MMHLRRAARAAAAVGAAALIGLMTATPAWAHAYITATSPAEGAHLATAPTQVTLTFDESVTQVHVAVEGPDGLRWDDGQPVALDDQVTQKLYPLGPAGAYQVNYRVVSVDGHTVNGTVTFDLTTPGHGTPPPQPTSANPGAGGVPWWLVVPVAVGAAVVTGFWFRTSRRRAAHRVPPCPVRRGSRPLVSPRRRSSP